MICLLESYEDIIEESEEKYREVQIYNVNGKKAYMMSVIKNDGYARAYNMDMDTYYNSENEDDYTDEIPRDILEKLVELSEVQIMKNYKELV